MNDLHSSVIPLSPDLPYEDGSEDRILQILRSATDRSAGSDELASHISDWPTRYHLSRLRQNLFRPFHFTSQHRVLEIGCGTGANIRAIAETGAEVVGVEGTYVRALAARTRCEGMKNVTIYAGDANDLPDIGLFDAVLLIGVLEYSGASVGGRGGPDQLLQTARKHLKDDGQLILAIENQLGLKYLLSYPEDHLGTPWVGIEGYRNTNGIRTWSRQQLSSLLSKNGFTDQKWLFPFPDYKLPIFVASDELFASEVGRHLAKNVLRSPVVDYSGSRALVCDSASAFQTMVDAGLGPDISNSFLILAGSSLEAQDLMRDNEVGWLSSGERRSKWRRYRTIVSTNDTLIFQSDQSQVDKITDEWLSNIKESDIPFVTGTPLDDLIVQSFGAHDLKQAREYLEMYRKYLEQHAERNDSSSSGPFSCAPSSPSVPPDFLDCTPKNLLHVDGKLEFVDREWSANSRVDLEKIWIRGLFEVASDLVHRGTIQPLDPALTTERTILTLSDLGGVSLTTEEIKKFVLETESQYQKLVSGVDSKKHLEDALTIRLSEIISLLPITTRLKQMSALEDHHAHLQISIEKLNSQLNTASQIQESQVVRIQRLTETNTRLRNEINQLKNTASFRLGNFLVRPFAAIKAPFSKSKKR